MAKGLETAFDYRFFTRFAGYRLYIHPVVEWMNAFIVFSICPVCAYRSARVPLTIVCYLAEHFVRPR